MNKTIILADDYEITRWLIKQTLNNLGVEATILNASNGKEALDFFDGRKIDLIITDYNMPKMNGLDLLRSIKEMPFYADLPALLMTGSKDMLPTIKEQLPEKTSLLVKPYKLPQLTKELQRLLL